jgi:hypothetical protein
MLNDCSCGEPLFDYMEACPKCGAANPACAEAMHEPSGREIVREVLDDISGWIHGKRDRGAGHIYTHGPGGE